MENNKLSQLLVETASLLDGSDENIDHFVDSLDEYAIDFDNIDYDTLYEDAASAGIIAFIVAYLGALIGVSLIGNRMARKRIAKESIAISAEEYNKAIDFLMSLRKQIEALLKSSEYKKYVDDKIITISDDLPKIDLTDKRLNKDVAFYSWYCLFRVNVYELSKATGKYDEIITTEERFKEYLKKESEKIAKIIDKCRQLCNKNDFIKKNFSVVGEWNENKTVFSCLLYGKNSFVLNTSKYLKK